MHTNEIKNLKPPNFLNSIFQQAKKYKIKFHFYRYIFSQKKPKEITNYIKKSAMLIGRRMNEADNKYLNWYLSADSWTSSAALKKGSFSHRSKLDAMNKYGSLQISNNDHNNNDIEKNWEQWWTWYINPNWGNLCCNAITN